VNHDAPSPDTDPLLGADGPIPDPWLLSSLRAIRSPHLFRGHLRSPRFNDSFSYSLCCFGSFRSGAHRIPPVTRSFPHQTLGRPSAPRDLNSAPFFRSGCRRLPFRFVRFHFLSSRARLSHSSFGFLPRGTPPEPMIPLESKRGGVFFPPDRLFPCCHRKS